MQRYESYKHSGFEWLGEIPSHWDIKRNIGVFVERKESNQADMELLSVTINRGIIKQDEITAKKDGSNEDKSKYKVVRKNDLAYNKMRMWQGAIGASDYDGIVSPAYIVLRPRDALYSRYFHYLYRTEAFIAEANRHSYGLCLDMNSLRYEDFKTIYSPVPPNADVERIVNFLDQKTAEIDAAIAKKQRLIELLQEQKSILINQAVTRGLNPNVAMRDSGVDWIGEMPMHWEIAANRRFIKKIVQGSSPAIDNINDESGYAVAKISVVKAGQYIDGEVKPIPRKLYRTEYQINAGDFLLTRGNTPELVADVCYVDNRPSSPVMLSDLIYRLTFNSKKVDGRYMSYFFQCPIIRNQVRITARGSSSTMVKVSQEHIKSWIVFCPPIQEQLAIAKYLSELESKINEVIRMTSNEIDKLVELRGGVIAMAVTGCYRI